MFLPFLFSVLQAIFPEQIRNILQSDKNICTTRNCLRTALIVFEMSQVNAEMYRNSMNTAVQPCDNFFEYACANYPNIHKIPPHRDYFTSHVTRQENVNNILSDFIENINLLWPKGFQKVRKYYDLCMNEEQRRQAGYNTLQAELATIGMTLLPPFHLKTGPRNDFSEILGKIHRLSVRASKFLHNVSVWPHIENMQQNILVIGSSTEANANESEEDELRLPPDDELLVHYRRRLMISVINHLYNHSKYELTEDMKNDINQRVEEVLYLEDMLIKVILSVSQGPSGSMIVDFKPYKIKELMHKTLEGGEIQIIPQSKTGQTRPVVIVTHLLLRPILDPEVVKTKTLFSGFTTPDTSSVKTILEAEDSPITVTIKGFAEFLKTYEILRTTSSSAFESYIWWTVIESILEEGPAETYQYHKGNRAEEVAMNGPPTRLIPRDITCMNEIKKYFGNFVGHVLARKTNGHMKKQEVTEMLENIKKSYEESIQRTQWADAETKEATLTKIRKMTAFIGFDDSVLKQRTIDREYKKIVIQPGNYYKVLAHLYRKKREEELFKIFTTNDFNHKPESNPADLDGARYIRAHNYIVVPITEIHFPRWDLGLEVLHYATLGYVLAHEVGHSIDATGSRYNAEGDMSHCLTDDAAAAYGKIIQCFVDSYSKFFVYIPDKGFLRLNGQASVNENMADWQGFNMAMMAYKKYAKRHNIQQKLPGIFAELSPEQLFSLAFSNEYCINCRPKYLIHSATSTRHAPERTRVNGVLKNSRQFSDAWGCAADAPMNPPMKCEIWF